MAEFNPFIPNPNIPDWTNAPGRLIDGSGIGEIFGKVATSVAGTIGTAVDKKRSGDISKDMNAEWEDAVLKDSAAKAGLPEEVARGMKKVDLWNKAIAKGGVNQKSAYAQMESEVKRLSAKYPNRIDEIQQAYAKATGNTAANDLYKATADEYTANTKAENDAKDDVTKQFNTWAPYMDTDDVPGFMQADSATQAKAVVKAAARKNGNEKIDVLKNQMALKKDLRTEDAASKAPLFVQDINNELGNLYRGNLDKVIKTFEKAREDGTIDPKEREQLTSMIEYSVQQNTRMLDEKLSTPFGPSGQQTSWNEVFANDSGIIETERKRIEGYNTMLYGLLENKSGTGIVQMNATTLKMQQEHAQSEFARTDLGQQAIKVDAITKLYGDSGTKWMQENFGVIMDQVTGEGSTLATSISDHLKNDSMTPGSTLAGSVEDARKKVKPGEEKAFNAGSRAAIETSFKTIIDPNTDDAIWKQHAAFLYSPENARWFAALNPVENKQGVSQQELAFQKFTDPKVEAAFKARGQSKLYSDTIIEWSNSVYGSLPEDIRGAPGMINGSGAIGTESAKVSFNADTMLVDFRLDPAKVKDLGALRTFVNDPTNRSLEPTQRATGLSVGELISIKALSKNTQRINLIMKAQAGALRAQGMGDDKILEILQLNLGDLNVDKQSPFITGLLPMIGQYAKDVVTGKVAKDSQKERNKIRYGEDFGQNPDGTGMALSTVAEPAGGAAFDGLKTAKEKTPVLMGSLQSDLGLTDIQAAGIVGNLTHESAGLKPDAKGDSGAAHGWAQWNGPRKKDMIEWTTKQGLDPNSDEGNYAYLLHDLKENYPQVLSMLKKADTVEEATWIIEKHYEKPGVPHSSSRLAHANKALE